jgi:hypothetical protein
VGSGGGCGGCAGLRDPDFRLRRYPAGDGAREVCDRDLLRRTGVVRAGRAAAVRRTGTSGRETVAGDVDGADGKRIAEEVASGVVGVERQVPRPPLELRCGLAAVVDVSSECRRAVRVPQDQIVIEWRFVTVAMHDISVDGERTPSGCVQSKARCAIADTPDWIVKSRMQDIGDVINRIEFFRRTIEPNRPPPTTIAFVRLILLNRQRHGYSLTCTSTVSTDS